MSPLPALSWLHPKLVDQSMVKSVWEGLPWTSILFGNFETRRAEDTADTVEVVSELFVFGRKDHA